MLPIKVQDALNTHLNHEYYAYFLYLSMSAHCESRHLRGFARWLKTEATEELAHAMKMYDYLIQRGGALQLHPVAGPPTQWDSPLALFEDALGYEREQTTRIADLIKLAQAEGDHATFLQLQWFVARQSTSETELEQVIQDLKLVGSSGSALFMLDREMGSRKGGGSGDGTDANIAA